MSGLPFRIDDGPLQGWYADVTSASWQFRILTRTVTVHPPVQPDSVLRCTAALTVDPGDPQWELMAVLDRYDFGAIAARQVRQLALGLLLPRMHDRLAVGDGWTVQRGSSVTAAVSGRLADVDGPESTVRVSVTDSLRPGTGRRRLATRLSADGPQVTFGWARHLLLQHPALPTAEPRAVWSARTTQVLQSPLPGQPHPGQYVLYFDNAIGSGRDRRTADTLAQAQQLAATNRPFNNTRVSAHLVVGVAHGMAVTEPTDLGLTAQSGPSRAASAFPQPPAPSLSPSRRQPTRNPGGNPASDRRTSPGR